MSNNTDADSKITIPECVNGSVCIYGNLSVTRPLTAKKKKAPSDTFFISQKVSNLMAFLRKGKPITISTTTKVTNSPKMESGLELVAAKKTRAKKTELSENDQRLNYILKCYVAGKLWFFADIGLVLCDDDFNDFGNRFITTYCNTIVKMEGTEAVNNFGVSEDTKLATVPYITITSNSSFADGGKRSSFYAKANGDNSAPFYRLNAENLDDAKGDYTSRMTHYVTAHCIAVSSSPSTVESWDINDTTTNRGRLKRTNIAILVESSNSLSERAASGLEGLVAALTTKEGTRNRYVDFSLREDKPACGTSYSNVTSGFKNQVATIAGRTVFTFQYVLNVNYDLSFETLDDLEAAFISGYGVGNLTVERVTADKRKTHDRYHIVNDDGKFSNTTGEIILANYIKRTLPITWGLIQPLISESVLRQVDEYRVNLQAMSPVPARKAASTAKRSTNRAKTLSDFNNLGGNDKFSFDIAGKAESDKYVSRSESRVASNNVARPPVGAFVAPTRTKSPVKNVFSPSANFLNSVTKVSRPNSPHGSVSSDGSPSAFDGMIRGITK